MVQKLAILGASYLQLPLVLKAKQLGLETLCFAWDQDAVAQEHCDKFFPISVLEKQNIYDVCADMQIDGITSIASDICVPTVSYVATKLGLIGNTEMSAQLCTNKFHMRQTLSKSGLNCPQYVTGCVPADLVVQASPLRYPLIAKPVDRSGSLGVQKVESPIDLKEAVTNASELSLSGHVIVEEFIEGVEVSVETISWEGTHHHLCITDKETSGPPHFVELAHHQPSALPKSTRRLIERETSKSLTSLGVDYGASHAEFIVSENRVYITEIGARMGGDFIGSDLVNLSTGYDFLSAVISIALGHFQKPLIKHEACSGVLFYSSESPEVWDLIHRAEQEPQLIRAELNGNQLNPLQSSSDRSGFVIYQSDRRYMRK